MSGILTRTVMKHLSDQNVLAFEQKGLWPGSRGTKDQLLIDKMIGIDCTNLAVCWIDFQESLQFCPSLVDYKLYKIHSQVRKFLQQSMSMWNTILTVDGLFMAHIHIKCGIFQEDSISPLLFVWL